MVDWRRVGVLSAAVVITGGVFYVLWSLLSSRRRRKRRADEEPQPQFLPQPVPQQVKADEKLQSPSQPVRLQAEAGEKPKSPPLSQAVQQPEVDEKPQSLAQPQHVRQESEAQLFQPQHVRQESEVQLPQHVLQESEVQLSQPQHVRQESEVQLSQLQHVRQESDVQLPQHVWQESDVQLSQPQHVWQESEVQLEERRKEEPREEEEPPPQLGEPFQQVSTTSEPPLQEKPSDSKYVLVLGLDGAGKSSILNSLAASRAKHCATPTEGLNALCIATEDAKVEFLELGGSENLRSYWNMYLSKAHLLIFVVDSADHVRLPLAKRYLFEATNINPLLPVMILANKQDLEDAFSITQIHEALSLSEIGGDRKLFLISTHVALEGAEITTGLQDAKDLISQIVMNTFDLESKAPSANLANELEGPMDEAK